MSGDNRTLLFIIYRTSYNMSAPRRHDKRRLDVAHVSHQTDCVEKAIWVQLATTADDDKQRGDVKTLASNRLRDCERLAIELDRARRRLEAALGDHKRRLTSLCDSFVVLNVALDERRPSAPTKESAEDKQTSPLSFALEADLDAADRAERAYARAIKACDDDSAQRSRALLDALDAHRQQAASASESAEAKRQAGAAYDAVADEYRRRATANDDELKAARRRFERDELRQTTSLLASTRTLTPTQRAMALDIVRRLRRDAWHLYACRRLDVQLRDACHLLRRAAGGAAAVGAI